MQATGCAEKIAHCRPQGVQKKLHTADNRVCAEKSAHCRPQGVCRKKCTLQTTGCAEKSCTLLSPGKKSGLKQMKKRQEISRIIRKKINILSLFKNEIKWDLKNVQKNVNSLLIKNLN